MQQQQQPSQSAQTAQNQNQQTTGSTLVATQFINAWDDLARFIDLFSLFVEL